ncbi:hypothetical protein AKJ36_01795 [candidate division MSBL1 archaeon SCGC-AAA259I07]|uniref:Uncharacterized protein n=1 Tax=candidate division MSBL1 archaeon SCGC-AAA259I07 TaxID=1698266 RepID=A0A133ULB1_9EURY|nr:hypothetical protein AKJ36_01795 [candidate division MSBL1 archaeon SCGC-AAA259I07]
MKEQSDALKFIVVGILISAVVMIGTRWLLPMIFGVTFTGLVAMISNRLSAVGGVLGSITGGVGEYLGHYSTYVMQPLMQLNPYAVIGFLGVVAFASVIIVNIFTYNEVWM